MFRTTKLINPNIVLFLYPFTVYSSFAIDFLLTIVSLFALYFFFINFNRKNIINKFVIPLLIMYLILLINLFFSSDISSSFSRIVLYMRYIFFAYFFFIIFEKYKFNINYLIIGLEVNLFFICMDSLFQYFFGYDIFGNLSSGIRLSGPFDRLIVGSVISKLIFVLIVCYYFTNNPFNAKKIIIVFLSLILIFLSAERSPFYTTTILLFVFFLNLHISKSFKLLIILLVTFTSLALIKINTSYFDRYITQTIDTVLNKQTGNTSQYQQHFSTAYEIFRDNYLTGSGIKTFRNECSNSKYEYIGELRCSTHPHNMYMELLSEMGLLGILFLISMYYFIFINVLKNHKLKSQIVLALPLLIFLFPFQTHNSFFNNWLSGLFWFTLVIVFVISKYEKR